MKCRYCDIIFDVLNDEYGDVCDDCWECECGECDACVSKAELSYEHFVEDFYGDSEPFTLKEKNEN